MPSNFPLSSFGGFTFGQSPFGGYPYPVPTLPLQKILAAYPYQEYADDPYINAFFEAFNELAQEYTDWYNQIQLGDWTNPNITGDLLDWIALGLYGLERPLFPIGAGLFKGTIDTYAWAEMPELADAAFQAPTGFLTATDDIFKAYMTWVMYLGDGKRFNVRWLKRRVKRFLTYGQGPIDQTYDISVIFQGNNQVLIRLLNQGESYDPNAVQALILGVSSGILTLPFQYSFSVELAS